MVNLRTRTAPPSKPKTTSSTRTSRPATKKKTTTRAPASRTQSTPRRGRPAARKTSTPARTQSSTSQATSRTGRRSTVRTPARTPARSSARSTTPNPTIGPVRRGRERPQADAAPAGAPAPKRGRPRSFPPLSLAEAEAVFKRKLERNPLFKKYQDLIKKTHWTYAQIRAWFASYREKNSRQEPGNPVAPAPENNEEEQEEEEEDGMDHGGANHLERVQQGQQNLHEPNHRDEQEDMNQDGTNQPEQNPEAQLNLPVAAPRATNVAVSVVEAPASAAPPPMNATGVALGAMNVAAPIVESPRVPAKSNEARRPIPGGVAPPRAPNVPGTSAQALALPVAPRVLQNSVGPSETRPLPRPFPAQPSTSGPASAFQFKLPKQEPMDTDAPSTSAAPNNPWRDEIRMVIPIDAARRLGTCPADLIGFEEIDHAFISNLEAARIDKHQDLANVILPFSLKTDYTSWTRQEFCQFLVQFLPEEKVKALYGKLDIKLIKNLDMFNRGRMGIMRQLNKGIPKEKWIIEKEFLEIGEKVSKIRQFKVNNPTVSQ